MGCLGHSSWETGTKRKVFYWKCHILSLPFGTMSCLQRSCRLPGRQLEGRTPTHALACSGCCLKHAGGPVTHGCSPAEAHRTPQTHTEQGASLPGREEWNFRGRQDRLHWQGNGHGFSTKPLFASSGLLKKKKVIKMLAAASVGCQEQSWIWLLCIRHDCTSPISFSKKPACSSGERVFGFSYALFSQSGISYA